MSINMQVKVKTGAIIEVNTAEKKVEKEERKSFIFEMGKDMKDELETLKEVLERNTYGGR